MAGVFINYRTGDDAYAAGLLDQRLCHEFGDDRVFRDRRALRPGMDFPPELWRRLKLSTVLLALIGPRWLTLTDKSGNRRIDNPKDYVRREIRQALKRDICVIPVLLAGAPLPEASVLPVDIAALSRRQCAELRVHEVDQDLDHLVEILVEHVPRQVMVAPPASGGRQSTVDIRGRRIEIDGPVVGGDMYA